MVDADGKPLVVYHGTSKDFDAFDVSRAGERDPGFYGKGIYLTPSRELAVEYADGPSPRVIEAYAAVQRPFEWDVSTPELEESTLFRAREVMPDLEVGAAGVRPAMVERWTESLKDAGYDGVIVTVKGLGDETPHEIIAFNATQVKSTANPGTFDPNNASMIDRAVDRVKAASDLISTQPARSLDELYAVAPAHQKTLGEVGADLGEKYGAEWRDPGIKKQATSAEKMQRKRYDSTRRLTDVVRGGYVVKDPGQADNIVADLAKRFTVVDEGWRITAAGYFDRKAMVQFDDGTIGEVQFWHPEMLDAKKSGHDLYEEMRLLPDGDPRYLDLLDQQRDIYLATLDKVGDEWLPIVSQLSDELVAMSGRPTRGNAASNSASVSGRPESMTSSNRTGSQAPPSETMAQAELPDMIAGLDSQSKNVGSMRGNMGADALPVNGAEPRPEPPPEGLDAAAARVGTGEDMKALATQFGVDEAGGFVEQADIDRLKELGRLTPEEIDALEIADQQYDDAGQYGEMLKYIAATCGVRG